MTEPIAAGTCAYCGSPFKPKRSSAKYCSPACRLQAHRGLSVSRGDTEVPETSVSSPGDDTVPHGEAFIDRSEDFEAGWQAGMAKNRGPFPMMTDRDLAFYRGWHAARIARRAV